MTREPAFDKSPAEVERLEHLARRLEADRPVPPLEFRGRLGRAVVEHARRHRVRSRPTDLWVRVVGLWVAGAALLAAAATQL